ncbi:MAG: TonB family protein [Acidobacteriota bacterium]|nr:TonB family protein [Acidobacteriota bacterium]NLH09884.1 TonB family protein [Holophagae bacterium]
MIQRGLTGRLQAAAGELAFRDDLTGLYNRRLLSHLFAQWWDELCREHHRIALIILDLDGFKEVNDRFGHLAGDLVLRRTAELLRRTFRSDDVLVRFGGDEFVVLLPGAGQAEADSLGQRARDAVSSEAAGESSIGSAELQPVSFSLGVAAFPEDGTSGEEILARADERLYTDKRSRRRLLRSVTSSSWRMALLLGLGGVVAAAFLVLFLWLISGREPTMTVTPATSASGPPPPAASPHEHALLEEIARLRRELALRESRVVVGPSPVPDPTDTQELRARILELEQQLDQQRARLEPPAAPIATPPVVASAIPAPPPPSSQPSPVTPALAAVPTPRAPLEIPPRLIGHELPAYPERARRYRREATVELRLTVDETGKVIRVRPLGPPVGLGFEEAARRAALTASYVPGQRDGVPVTMDTTLAVVFRLDTK